MTMRVYSLETHDDVQLLDADVAWQATVLRTLGRGVRHQGVWRPVRVTRLRKPRKRRTEALCDFTAIGSSVDVPALSARAKGVVAPLLGEGAEWLPLSFDETDYWLLNILTLVDALDLDKSVIRTLPNGKVLNIDTYAFRWEAIEREWLFKVPQHPYRVLCSERFRSVAASEQLTGLFFQPLWDSGHEPFRPAPSPAEMIARPEIYGPEGFVDNMREYWPPEWKERARKIATRGRR